MRFLESLVGVTVFVCCWPSNWTPPHPSSKGAVVVVVATGEAEGGADDGEDAADGARAQDRIQEMMVVIEKEGRKEGWTDLFVWELGVYGDSYLILISLIVD